MHDVFFFTDIHGQYELYKAIMAYCYEQDPEATIIFGGDAIDRGRNGYKIMRELLDNPKVIYLMGNHEDMFCTAARNIKRMFSFKNPVREKVEKELRAAKIFDWKYSDIRNSLNNGGLSTLTDWVMDGMPMEIVERIERLPRTFSYEKCDFCHAAGIYKIFKIGADAEYNGEPIDEYTAESLIWSRSALEFEWEPNRMVVFGHTPTVYLSDFIDIKVDDAKPIQWNNKLDMDTGAVFTGKAYVLNVLTMKAQGFELEDNVVKKIECIQFQG